MKASNLLVVIMIFCGLFISINSTNAQLCSPNPMYTGNGVFPDTVTNMQPGCMGTFYQETFTINVPPDTTIFGFTFTINYMQVTGVTGLPPGLTYGCNPINCTYPGNSSGCFQVYGTPSVGGTFDLVFQVTGSATHPVFGTQVVSINYSGYHLHIGAHPTLTTGNLPTTCNLNNGSAWVTASGSSGYSYSWNTIPVSTNDSIFNLVAGIYITTVNDLYNCASSDTVFVNDLGAPQIDSIAVTNELCFGDSNGTATAYVSGGTSPYHYDWSNGDTLVTMTGVQDGTYTLQVTDINGCITNDVTVITEPSQLLAFASHTDALCNGINDGSATASIIGGTGSYDYSWTSGDMTLIADSLLAGTYTITVTDDNGCTATSSTTVGEPTALTTNITGTDALCFGGSNGTASVVAGGGTPGYTYSWNNLATTPSTLGLFSGTYYVTVTDTNGCSTMDSVFIDQPPMLTLSFTTVPESMLTMVDGSIDATPGGGTPGYTYLWNNGATTQDISNLAGGTYTLTLTDINGCSIMDTVTVQTLPGFGIEEEKTLFGFYPNPAHDFFYLEMRASGTLMLFDLTGKMILNKNVLQGKQMIEIPKLSKGVYMLSVMVDNKKQVTKLIVD